MAYLDRNSPYAEERNELFENIYYVVPLPASDLDWEANYKSVMADFIGVRNFLYTPVDRELDTLIAMGYGFGPPPITLDNPPIFTPADDEDLIEHGQLEFEGTESRGWGRVGTDLDDACAMVNQSIDWLMALDEGEEEEPAVPPRYPVIPLRINGKIRFLNNHRVGVEGFNVGGRLVHLVYHGGYFLLRVKPVSEDPYYIDLKTKQYSEALIAMQKWLRVLESQVSN